MYAGQKKAKVEGQSEDKETDVHRRYVNMNEI